MPTFEVISAEQVRQLPAKDSLCECGCGEVAGVYYAPKDKKHGTPKRFCKGHNKNGPGPAYAAQDCGYATPCWVWQRKIVQPQGYGRTWIKGKQVYAHRAYYERYIGPIPDGLTVDHLCRNRRCVNPAHLELVPPAENVRRGDHAKKLTAVQVARIRTSTERRTVLARKFGVTPEAIDYHRKKAT